MKTVNEVSEALSKRTSTTRYRKTKLADDSGVNYRTLQHVLRDAELARTFFDKPHEVRGGDLLLPAPLAGTWPPGTRS